MRRGFGNCDAALSKRIVGSNLFAIASVTAVASTAAAAAAFARCAVGCITRDAWRRLVAIAIAIAQRGLGICRRIDFGTHGAFNGLCARCVAITSTASAATTATAFTGFRTFCPVGTRGHHAGLRIDEGRCGQRQLIGGDIGASRCGAAVTVWAFPATASATAAATFACLGGRFAAPFSARFMSLCSLATTVRARATGFARGAGVDNCRVIWALAPTAASATTLATLTASLRAPFGAALTTSAATPAAATTLAAAFWGGGWCCRCRGCHCRRAHRRRRTTAKQARYPAKESAAGRRGRRRSTWF